MRENIGDYPTPKRTAARTAARIAAEKRNDAKRKGMPRLPSARLTSEEEEEMQALYRHFDGSKKAAILAAVRSFTKNLDVRDVQD